METLQHVFPLHQAHPLPATPVLAQGPPLPHVLGTLQMPDSPGVARVVVDLPDAPKVVVVSFDSEPMEGFEGHLEEEDNPKED